MATTALWDEEFLKTRAADARAKALDAQNEADWQQAVHQLARGQSDAVDGYVICASARCRRARRCIEQVPKCRRRTRTALPAHVEQALIQQIYARIQIARRDAALRAADAEQKRAPWL